MEWWEFKDMVSLFSHHYLHISCCMFCWSCLPWGWTASQEDPIVFQSLSLIRTVLSVETKTHSFIEGLVISYPNFTLNQFEASLLLPRLQDLEWGGGSWPSLLLSHTSFTAPHHPAACSSSRVNTRGSDIRAEGGCTSSYISLCCWQFSLGYQSCLCEATVTYWYIQGSSEDPHGTPPAQFPRWLKNHLTSDLSIYFTVCVHCLGHLTRKGQDLAITAQTLCLSQCCLTQGEHTRLSLPNGGRWVCHCWHPLLTSLSWAALAISQLPNSLFGKQASVSVFTHPQSLHRAPLWWASGSSARICLGREMSPSYCCHDPNL